MAKIQGLVEPGFEGVGEAFARNFAEHDEVGAGFCLLVEGRKVVDLRGGVADPATDKPYDFDTLQLVFSTTKGFTAIAANLLADRGLLDVDAPVAEYWPEFAAAGKEGVLVRHVLCHQAGLPVIDARLSLGDALAWTPVIEALEAQQPLWAPGTAHGYHALTYGWLVGELIRRIDGRDLGTFVADELAKPLGLDLWIGLPEEHEHRVAPVIGGLVPEGAMEDPAVRKLIEDFIGPDTLLGRALTLNGAFDDNFNLPEVRAAQIGAANGITDATSLSRLYAGTIGTVDDGPETPLLSQSQIDAARVRQTSGNDRILFVETVFGLGFMLSSPTSAFGGMGGFGHYGAGGSVGFADPEHGIAFGYVMNKMQQSLAGDLRTRGLITATYAAIGAPPTFA